jgi:hypothetical protein
MVYCSSTTYQTFLPDPTNPANRFLVLPDPDPELMAMPGQFTTDAEIPADILAQLGITWDCPSDGNGIPFANVPVLALTETTTVLQGQFQPAPTVPLQLSPASPPPSTPSTTKHRKLGAPFANPSIGTSSPTPSPNGKPSPGFGPNVKIPIPGLTAPTPTPTPAPPPAFQTTIAGVPVSISGTNVLVGSQTLFPHSTLTVAGTPIALSLPPASVTTVAGTPITAPPSAAALVVGSSTIPLPQLAAPTPAPPLITIGNAIFTPNALSQLVIGTQTLTPGGTALVVAGTTLSLATGGTALVVGSSTVPLGALATVPVITVAGQTLTADAQSAFELGSQTLVPGGPAVTVSGTAISLAPGATQIVIGGLTEHIGASATVAAGVHHSSVPSSGPSRVCSAKEGWAALAAAGLMAAFVL